MVDDKQGCCGKDSSENPVENAEYQLRFVRDLLIACAADVDAWYENFGGDADPKKAVKEIRKHLMYLMVKMQKLHNDPAPVADETKMDPTVCYSNYYACLAAHGVNCAGALQMCLANPKGQKKKI